jgi:hypothetical protein
MTLHQYFGAGSHIDASPQVIDRGRSRNPRQKKDARSSGQHDFRCTERQAKTSAMIWQSLGKGGFSFPLVEDEPKIVGCDVSIPEGF